MASPSPRHRVGCVDYESARSECAYKIYYPTTAVPSSRPWSRPPNVETWLAYYGMTVFMFGVDAWPLPLRALVAVLCRGVWIVFRLFATLDAVEHAPLAPGRFDVVLFSHGLAGFATCNAGVALQLASRGFVVFAVQHRDGRAAVSKVSASCDGGRGARWWTYASNGGVFSKRRAQAETRARETELCAETVDELHRGTAAPNALPEKSLDVSMMFVGRLRPRDKTLMGFSFGGGTSVKVSARSDAFARVVLQDAWLEYATDRDEIARACAMRPTLSIKSERWGANAKTPNERILKSPGPSGAVKPFVEVEVPGSRHHCFSDVSFFLGVAKKALGMIGDVDTRTFHAFNAELIAAFVRSGTDRALRRVVKDFADDLPGVALRFPSRLQK